VIAILHLLFIEKIKAFVFLDDCFLFEVILVYVKFYFLMVFFCLFCGFYVLDILWIHDIGFVFFILSLFCFH